MGEFTDLSGKKMSSELDALQTEAADLEQGLEAVERAVKEWGFTREVAERMYLP